MFSRREGSPHLIAVVRASFAAWHLPFGADLPHSAIGLWAGKESRIGEGRKDMSLSVDDRQGEGVGESKGQCFWQNGFFRGFLFSGPPDFFVDFVAKFIVLISVGRSAQTKFSRKIPGKIPQSLYNKNPRHISAEGPGQELRGE